MGLLLGSSTAAKFLLCLAIHLVVANTATVHGEKALVSESQGGKQGLVRSIDSEVDHVLSSTDKNYHESLESAAEEQFAPEWMRAHPNVGKATSEARALADHAQESKPGITGNVGYDLDKQRRELQNRGDISPGSGDDNDKWATGWRWPIIAIVTVGWGGIVLMFFFML